jgi:hypothetical protein
MSVVFDVTDFDLASSGSLLRMQPLPNSHAYFADYDIAVLVVDALATLAPVHLSGPSGTGKTHMLNSLLFGPPANFYCISNGLGLPQWPRIRAHRILVSMYETPGEVWYKTGVVRFTTLQQPQKILEVLEEASADPEALHIVWLVESGRGISSAVQGGWLEIVGQRTIREPNGKVFELGNVAFVTDSNHSANVSGEFSIWDLDQAYGRRWTRRINLAALSPDQEAAVLRELAPAATDQQIQQVVSLAVTIRQKHEEGGLRSCLPPTIDAELDLLGCMSRLRQNTRTLVFNTLLGHCASREIEEAETAYAEAFGVQVKTTTAAAEAVGIL